MRREYMVCTDVGDYRVWAYDRADARRVVERLTYGRAKVDYIEAAS